MTLGQFFELVSQKPAIIIFYVIALPLTAFLTCVMGKGEGHLSPWKYVISALVYLACIPGMFAFTLNIYLFVFERQSIFDTNLYTQVLPIITMFLTLYFINQNISLKDVPGFGKVSGLMLVLMSVFLFMWFMEKTRLIIFSYLPIQYIFLAFGVLLIAIRYGFKMFTAKE